MKRRISLLMALVVCVMALYGCGNTGAQPAGAEQNKVEASGTESAEPAAAGTEAAGTEAAGTETAGAEAAAAGETIEVAPEFEPNADYDKYALVDYTVEDIAARFVATVSSKGDGEEYEIHCSVDGVEQVVTLDKDLNIVSDMTGNMSYDAPLIVQKAIDEGNWMEIN